MYDNKVYKNGQRFYVGDYLQCVCSPEFNGKYIFLRNSMEFKLVMN